jgi:hypothetical protein
MEEPQTPLTTGKPSPPATSLGTRLTNVFVAPAEVFDEVKASPPTAANWVVPTVIAIIAGVIYTMVVFSQPGVLQNMRDAQDKKMQELVATGKMTQAQADQSSQITEKFMTPTFFKAIGILAVVIFNPVSLFLFAAVLWLVGRYALQGKFEYMKAVEVAGLAAMISVLGALVSMLLAVIYANPAMTPSLVLFVSHFDPQNKVHLLLSALNLMTLWYIGVLALGLAKLSGATFGKAAAWLYGLWYGIWALFALGLPVLLAKLKPS